LDGLALAYTGKDKSNERSQLSPELLIAHLFVAYVVIAEPLLGYRMYQTLKRTLPQDKGARIRFYRQLIIVAWMGVLVIAVFVLLSPARLADLGFRWPQAGMYGWLFTGGISALLVVQTIVLWFSRSSLAENSKFIDSMQHIWHMLPRSDREQRTWIGLSFTAGICEEIAYRGFLFYYLQELWDLSIIAAVILSSVVFGLAHIYQGPRAAAGTAVMALFMAGIYAATGSLLIPIVLHVLQDWKALMLVPMIREADNKPAETT